MPPLTPVQGAEPAGRVTAGGVGTNGSVSFTVMPSAPTIGSITASSRQLTVAFTAGADNGQTVTNFQYSTDGGTTWRDRTDSGTTASPLTITKLSTDGTTDLVNGTAYAVQVRAYVSATAIGSASARVSATKPVCGVSPATDGGAVRPLRRVMRWIVGNPSSVSAHLPIVPIPTDHQR